MKSKNNIFDRPKGLPRDFQEEIYAACKPICDKYLSMNKPHISKGRLRTLAEEAIMKALFMKDAE